MPAAFVRLVLPVVSACISLTVHAVERERHSHTVPKVFEFASPDTTPIVFSVRSRAEGAYAQLYCAYLDVHYADGSHDWHKIAHFTPGTHGWERATGAFAPVKPVKKLELFGIFRDGVGRVEFDGHAIERRDGTNDVLEVRSMTDLPYSDSDVTSRKVFRGRSVAVETERTSPSKLAKRCPLAPGDIKVWTESSLATVTPLTFPSADSLRSIELELAGRESESAQILVTSSSAVDGVRLRLGELVR